MSLYTDSFFVPAGIHNSIESLIDTYQKGDSAYQRWVAGGKQGKAPETGKPEIEASRTDIAFRNLRPSDVNLQMTQDTRQYLTTGIGVNLTRLLGTTGPIVIPVDNWYLIYGWDFVPSAGTPFSDAGLIRAEISSTTIAEWPLYRIKQAPTGRLLTTDLLVWCRPNDSVELRIRDGLLANRRAVVMPVGVRFGPKSQIKYG